MLQAQVVLSKSTRPALNLALEHHLFQQASLPLLFLYQNKQSVILGRNQNPWLETDPLLLAENKVTLCRRYSGGGAVYHDLGNVNYCYMTSRASFSRSYAIGKLCTLLQAMHKDVAVNHRHDLLVKGKKCSGSAFKIAKERAYAHGTMLLSSQLDQVKPFLTSSRTIVKAQGTDSVRSAVANLEMETERFIQAAAKAFSHEAPFIMTEEEIQAVPAVQEAAATLETWDWTFGQTPKFQVSLAGFQATIVKGRVAQLFGVDGKEVHEHALLGTRYR